VELRLTLEPNTLARSIERGDMDWEARVAAAYHRLAIMQKRVPIGNSSTAPPG
jgi:hypothetical protein